MAIDSDGVQRPTRPGLQITVDVEVCFEGQGSSEAGTRKIPLVGQLREVSKTASAAILFTGRGISNHTAYDLA